MIQVVEKKPMANDAAAVYAAYVRATQANDIDAFVAPFAPMPCS
jgi:hypothetical protein